MAAKYFSDLFKLTSPTDFEIFLEKMSTLVTYNKKNTILTLLFENAAGLADSAPVKRSAAELHRDYGIFGQKRGKKRS